MKNNHLKISLLLCIVLILSILKGYSVTFTVDNTTDVDNGTAVAPFSLRKCIRLANANANAPTIDNIMFAASLTGGITITLTSALPFITDPLLIDGFTANGYVAPTPRVSILAGGNTNAFNIASGGNNSTIRGFAVSNTAYDGIYINGATGVTITGCYIGLLATGALPGTAAAQIGGHGIYITGGSNNAVIGIATAAGLNVISGCLGHGVVVTGCSGIVFKNNYIGTNIAGAAAISNGLDGVNITNTPSCIIGGAAANEGNLISGNKNSGIVLSNASSNAVIKGNKIGTNLAGTASLTIANSIHGISIYTNVLNTIIGGGLAGEGNLISGNTLYGINNDDKSSGTVIKGNKIGTDITGALALSNAGGGVNIDNSSINAIIGGAISGEGNVVSGNGAYGIFIRRHSAGAIIKGNKIGTNLAGTAAIGNYARGIYSDSSDNMTIGGPSKIERNIISGNGSAANLYLGNDAILISNSNGHTIKGNFIGISVTGLYVIPNFDTGISMANSTGNTIGGATYMERNVSSGNLNYGIYFSNIDNTSFTGNYLGTDSTGNAPLGNGQHGVTTNTNSDNITWTSNVFSGNLGEGMDLNSCTNNTLYGNFVGLGVNGTTKVANKSNGIRIGGGATNNIVGGTAAGQPNYIAGNGNGGGALSQLGSHGIYIDVWSSGMIIKGNYIGSDKTGMIAIGNSGAGVMFLQDISNNIIGGTAAGEGNLICCSTGENGIRMQLGRGNVVYGNLIGVNAALSLASGFGNNQNGVYMSAYNDGNWVYDSNNNIIGSLGAGANIIANNGGDGVHLLNGGGGVGVNFNPIIGNKIYCNGGLGINMETNSALENEGVPAPVVISSVSNSISGTGISGNTIHVYRNQYSDGARCDCEGEIYVGTTVVAGGTWSLTHNLGLNSNQILSVTATQTNPTNSTSEFWVCSVPLPVDMLSLEAVRNNNVVDVNFAVASESNINSYNILRSNDGINFEMIGSEMPLNNVNGITSYSFEDSNPLRGTSYYRIQTVENDGRVAHSKIVSTTDKKTSVVTLFPNPATDEVTILSSNAITRIEMQNTLGQMVFEKSTVINELTIPLNNLATGVYFVKIYEGETAKIYKLEKR